MDRPQVARMIIAWVPTAEPFGLTSLGGQHSPLEREGGEPCAHEFVPLSIKTQREGPLDLHRIYYRCDVCRSRLVAYQAGTVDMNKVNEPPVYGWHLEWV